MYGSGNFWRLYSHYKESGNKDTREAAAEEKKHAQNLESKEFDRQANLDNRQLDNEINVDNAGIDR